MKKLILPLFFATFFLVFNACKENDDTPSELGATEAKVALTTNSTTVEADFKAMESHEGNKALMQVTQMNPFGEGGFDFSSKELFDALDKKSPAALKKAVKKTEEQTSFSDIVGTYTYNFDTQSWNITLKDPSDKIVVNFPTEGSTTNNATWTIYAFEEKEFTENGEPVWELARLKMDIVIDGEKVYSQDLTIDFSSDGNPEKMTHIVELPPYTRTTILEVTSTSMKVSDSLTKDDTSLYSFNIDATFETDPTSEESFPSNITGGIQYGALKIEGNLDMKGIMTIMSDPNSMSDPNQALADANEKINISLYTYPELAKIGEIKIGFPEGENEPTIVIEFNDGTMEPAEKYLKELLEEVEKILNDGDDNEEEDPLF